MRNTVLALLLTFSAVSLGCSDPARVARREVDRIVRVTLTTDTQLQRSTQEALKLVAVREGTAMGVALRQAGCPSGASSQPASAPLRCHEIAKAGRNKYEAEVAKVIAVARKADQAITSLWAGLRLVVDALQDLEAGANRESLLLRLAPLVTDLTRLSKDAIAAYQAVRTLAGGAP